MEVPELYFIRGLRRAHIQRKLDLQKLVTFVPIRIAREVELRRVSAQTDDLGEPRLSRNRILDCSSKQ
jgi:hypothetical protein